jgi:hypothetical protein
MGDTNNSSIYILPTRAQFCPMSSTVASDWGEISPQFDEIAKFLNSRDITTGNEAKTRFDVIDRIIKDVLGWRHGQIEVEERCDSKDELYVDYVLRSGDATLIIEAKKSVPLSQTLRAKNN